MTVLRLFSKAVSRSSAFSRQSTPTGLNRIVESTESVRNPICFSAVTFA